jgi:Domain of unknown function (DUF4261)
VPAVKKPQIIVGVPGRWASRSEIVRGIARKSGGYLFAGSILMDTATNDAFTLEIYEHDPRLREAFEVAGGGRYTKSQLNAIESHTYTLYAICEGGSCESAWKMMRAARALIRAGGIGVKVESSGIAIKPRLWCEWAESDFLPNLYHAFVVQLFEQNLWSTCGMHNFGYRDLIVETDRETDDDARKLIHDFQLYELLEAPKLKSGHTFSVDDSAPRYRIAAERCKTYPRDDPFHNPYGMWRLALDGVKRR